MSIHIKKSHKGLLHKNLGVKQGEPIPASKLAIKSTDSPAVKRRKQFAINAKKWQHQDGGTISELGYKNGSPHLDKPELDINTTNGVITTDNMAFPIEAEGIRLYPNTGDFQFNKKKIKEKKIKAQMGASFPYDPVKNPKGVKINPNAFTPPEAVGSYKIPGDGNYVSYPGDSLTDNQIKIAARQQYNNNSSNNRPNTVIAGAYDINGEITNHGKSIDENRGRDISYYNLSDKDNAKIKKEKSSMNTLQKIGAYFYDNNNYLPTPEKKKGGSISPNKAREILHDGTANGHPITDKQRRFFGAKSKGATKSFQRGGVETDEYGNPIYPHITPTIEPISSGSLASPSPNVDTSNLGGEYNGVISSESNKAPKPKKSGTGYGGAPSLPVGAGIGLFEGIVSSIIGPDKPRKRRDDTLVYNPYPQGTGSQAIYQDGGVQPKLVDQVPEGYKPYDMKNGIPGASYFMKETSNSSKVANTRISTGTGNIKPRRGTPITPNMRKRAASIASTMQDFVYTKPQATASSSPAPQKAFDGESVYTGNNLSYLTQMQVRNSGNNEDSGIMNTHNGVAVMHPVYPNTAIPNMNETYEIPADVYNNYFVGGSNRFRGSQDSLQHYRVPNNLKKGGKMPYCEDGDLQTIDGGRAPKISNNPFDGGTGEFQGNSHANGGIESTFHGKPFEAEGGEPYRMDHQGNLEIFGDLINPVTGNKFKKDGKILAEKEKKASKFTDKGLDLIRENEPSDSKWNLLKFNSGTAMLKGGLDKQKELAASKEHLSFLQKVALEQENPSNASHGGTFQDGGTPWEYRGTKKDKLDKKILGFVDLATQKGLTGYSGEKGGYDKRNTSTGRPSRHGANQALDMIFSQPGAYEKIVSDPELSGYLYNNGLTAINEYDPNVASKTGATTGHIHIGYDRGTPTSDQFRKDYKSRYSPKTQPAYISAPSSKPYMDQTGYLVPVGDAYTENPLTGSSYTFNTPLGDKPSSASPTPYPQAKPFDFKQPPARTFNGKKDRLPLEQILPVIPQVFDQPDYVDTQTFQPDLYTPYQVSFQDRLNEHAKSFNALAPSLVNNPEAQSVLAGQKYAADSGDIAEEFRTNQAITNEITNKNVALLNDAKMKNLQIRDVQQTRQAQAVANTRDRRTQAGIQIGDILAKNRLENKTAKVYQNLYRDYAFDKDMNLQYVGDASAGEQIDSSVLPLTPDQTTVTTKAGDTTTQQRYINPNNTLEPVTIQDAYRKRARNRMPIAKIARLMYP